LFQSISDPTKKPHRNPFSAHGLSENLADYKKISIENIIFNTDMQFKLISIGFILNAYCKNELYAMKNASNESNE
jgi:hypothetical protein